MLAAFRRSPGLMSLVLLPGGYCFPAFYAIAVFGARLLQPCIYLQNFPKFRALILHPKKNLLRISPRTGIWSTWYFLRSMEGMASTPLRKLDSRLNSSVPRYLCCSVCRFAFADIVFLQVRLKVLGRHWALWGHCSHWLRWNEAVHWPVLGL